MKYDGNSFNATKVDPIPVSRVTVWQSVDETFPGGAVMSAPTEAYPVGHVFAAGTPITVTDNVPGGVATIDGTTPTGMNHYDVTMGTNGCSFNVVTRGKALIDRMDVTLTTEQETHLKPRILMVKGV